MEKLKGNMDIPSLPPLPPLCTYTSTSLSLINKSEPPKVVDLSSDLIVHTQTAKPAFNQRHQPVFSDPRTFPRTNDNSSGGKVIPPPSVHFQLDLETQSSDKLLSKDNLLNAGTTECQAITHRSKCEKTSISKEALSLVDLECCHPGIPSDLKLVHEDNLLNRQPNTTTIQPQNTFGHSPQDETTASGNKKKNKKNCASIIVKYLSPYYKSGEVKSKVNPVCFSVLDFKYYYQVQVIFKP